tara:strand:+ start:1332 stop:1946 length:615 start_codon:yes stop_codon:yes gene_type:complete
LKKIKNQSGFMTMDFLFALVLILGFTVLLFRVSLTLTTASIVQYITFASARNYFAAHADSNSQVKMAEKKYSELVGNDVIKPLLANGWFEVLDRPEVGDISTKKPEFEPAVKNTFYGVGTTFVARILQYNMPFFGSTDPEGDESGSGFSTYIGSFLGREPSAIECLEFTARRWEMIRNLSPSRGASYSSGTSGDNYFPMEDSGC